MRLMTTNLDSVLLQALDAEFNFSIALNKHVFISSFLAESTFLIELATSSRDSSACSSDLFTVRMLCVRIVFRGSFCDRFTFLIHTGLLPAIFSLHSHIGHGCLETSLLVTSS